MGGLLSGIGELLGGFSAKEQIDKEGFDWREKRKAAQFERDRLEEEARQQDEDRAVNIGRDVLLGQEEGAAEPDLTSLIPGQTNRAITMGRIRGAVAQSKPALESMKLSNRVYEQDIKGKQRLDEIAARGDEMMKLEEKRQSRPLTAYEEARLTYLKDADEKDRAVQMARINRPGGGGGGRPFRSPGTVNPETGEAGTWQIYPDGRREWFPAMPTATMRDTAGMALTIDDSLKEMKDAAEKGVWNGPIVGRLSKMWQAAYPSGNEFLFDSAARRLVDIVYTKSGKQINQQEMEILKGLIPDRAKGNIEEQIPAFERYADGLLRRYQGMRPGAGGAPSKPRRKYNPTTGEFE